MIRMETVSRLVTVAIILLAPALPVTGQEVIDSICAVIDNDIILESDVAYGISSLLLEGGVRSPTPERIAELRRQVLDAYVNQKVLLAEALEESLVVEERTIDRELERKFVLLVQQVGSQQKLVDYFGRPLRQLKREMRQGVRDGLLVEMLKQQRLAATHIRRSEVIDFHREYTDSLPRMPERVALSHILMEVEPSPEAYGSARQRIDEIHNLLLEGCDFDSLAKIYSDDPTAEVGGRLGFTSRGDLVPEYEEVAYALQPGEISAVVQTRYGLHVIRLLERQGERILTQHILVKLSPTAEDRERAFDLARRIREQVTAGGDFADFARQYSDDSESVGQGGKLEPVAVEQLPVEFLDAIEVLGTGELSEPFQTEYGIHLVRLDDRLPERRISLNQDWQMVEQMALNYKREKVFQEWVESLKREHYIWQGGERYKTED